MRYIPTIGLEIHVELKTNSKMFCSCPNDPDNERPNVNVCPVCMGHPGTLPVPNGEAIKEVMKVGAALKCRLAERSKFDRKNYFYPDLPKGYQISQYDIPFCELGELQVKDRVVRVRRVHLEEDTGKLLHPTNEEHSLIDFNRAGVPLMELVTEPDISSGKEAREFAQELQLILRYLGASDADMEKGQMRIEANISVRKEEEDDFGTKVEVKNLNSFRSVERAIAYELEYQSEVLEREEEVKQETKGWDDTKGSTVSQREKEEAHDYRYFPEPDIPLIVHSREELSEIPSSIVELPQARRDRFISEYGLGQDSVETFVMDKDMGTFFERVASELSSSGDRARLIKLAANYCISDLKGVLGGVSVMDEANLITAENFAELIAKIEQGVVSSAGAKAVLKEMAASGADPDHIINERGLAQVSDEGKLEEVAKEVINANPKAVEDYASGKENALQFLVGQFMAKTKGSANPEMARKVLLKIFDS